MSLKFIKTNNQETRKLTSFENLFYSKFKQFFPLFSNLKVSIDKKSSNVKIKSSKTDNEILVWIENDEIGVEIGKWTHTHFNDIDECLLFIKDILDDFIVVWKVTRPNGYWYSGHYDIRLWQENLDKKDWNYNHIDEPDSLLDSDDKIHRFTFNKILEDS